MGDFHTKDRKYGAKKGLPPAPITEQIKQLQEQQSKLYTEARKLEDKIRDLKESRKKVCKHPYTKIVTQSYDEPGKVKYFEWREKICTSCGKVLGTSSKSDEWSKFK